MLNKVAVMKVFLGKLIKIPNYIKLSLLETNLGWKEVDIFDSIIH